MSTPLRELLRDIADLETAEWVELRLQSQKNVRQRLKLGRMEADSTGFRDQHINYRLPKYSLIRRMNVGQFPSETRFDPFEILAMIASLTANSAIRPTVKISLTLSHAT